MADSATTPAVKNTVELEADVNVEFNEAASRQQINSGESVKTLFGKLRKFLSDLKAVAFSGAYSDLSGTPDLTQYASKAKYGDTTINVGRNEATDVGGYSSALGYQTVASGDYSHAEGHTAAATGSCSHAEGYYTQAAGYDSHAGGYASTATGAISFAHGSHISVNNENEVGFGAYNKSSDNTLFSIGNGTSWSEQHNAFEITTTGGKLHDKDIATTDLIPTSLPANGGNADTVDGLHADSFVKNTSDWTPMKFEITYGDHNYPKTSIDDSIPIMPKACNYTFIVSRLKSDNSVLNIIAIPTDYDDDVMLYQVGTGVWKNVADGGNANSVGGKSADKIYYDNGISVDLNSATKSGSYAASPDTLNAPLSSWWVVDTMNYNGQFIVQKAHMIGSASTTVSYIRNYTNNAWSDWFEIYTSNSKPYVKGSATVAANSTTCTSNHGFTPSAVIWWDGNDIGVATWVNETQFAIKITSSVDRTINYLIFK